MLRGHQSLVRIRGVHILPSGGRTMLTPLNLKRPVADGRWSSERNKVPVNRKTWINCRFDLQSLSKINQPIKTEGRNLGSTLVLTEIKYRNKNHKERNEGRRKCGEWHWKPAVGTKTWQFVICYMEWIVKSAVRTAVNSRLGYQQGSVNQRQVPITTARAIKGQGTRLKFPPLHRTSENKNHLNGTLS